MNNKNALLATLTVASIATLGTGALASRGTSTEGETAQLRNTLSANAAKQTIPTARLELEDEDFPIVGGDSKDVAKGHAELRDTLSANAAKQTIPTARLELEDEDFPIVGGDQS